MKSDDHGSLAPIHGDLVRAEQALQHMLGQPVSQAIWPQNRAGQMQSLRRRMNTLAETLEAATMVDPNG